MFPDPPKIFSKKRAKFWFLLGDEAARILDTMQTLEYPTFRYHHTGHDVWWNVLGYRLVRVLEAVEGWKAVLAFFTQEPHSRYVTANPSLVQTDFHTALLALGSEVRVCNPVFSFEGLSIADKAIALREEILA